MPQDFEHSLRQSVIGYYQSNDRRKVFHLIVLNPTSGSTAQSGKMAERAASLNGSVIGLIDNGKKNSNTVLHAVLNRIKERFSIKEVVPHLKASFSHPIKETDAELLAKKCDFVLAGVGD